MLVRTDIQAAVGRITIDRPEARNALNAEVIAALDAALDAMEENDGVRVVVVTGAGKAFSAGADLDFMRRIAQAGAAANVADALALGRLFHRIAALAKPVLARVAGPAIGGGVGLMAACDVVLASEDAFFQFSEVRLGLVPAVISPFCVRRLGAATAQRMFLTGERFDAAEAERRGLVDRVVAPALLDEAVTEVCQQICRGAPAALGEAKKLIEAVSNLPPRDVLSYTSECIARLRAAPEGQEGITAYLEKRVPFWVRQAH